MSGDERINMTTEQQTVARRTVLCGISVTLGIGGLATTTAASGDYYITAVETSGRIESVTFDDWVCFQFASGQTALGRLSITGPTGRTFSTRPDASADQWCVDIIDGRTFGGELGKYRAVLTGGGRVIGRASFVLRESRDRGGSDDDGGWWPWW